MQFLILQVLNFSPGTRNLGAKPHQCMSKDVVRDAVLTAAEQLTRSLPLGGLLLSPLCPLPL